MKRHYLKSLLYILVVFWGCNQKMDCKEVSTEEESVTKSPEIVYTEDEKKLLARADSSRVILM